MKERLKSMKRNHIVSVEESENIAMKDDDCDTTEVICQSVANEMERVTETVNEIKSQNTIQAIFSGSKNKRALADNDVRISNAIKNIMNWMLIVTSAEMIRKEEYDELTARILTFDEDMNNQLQMQVKFKRAYEAMQKRQKQLVFYKVISVCSFAIGIIAIILAIVM